MTVPKDSKTINPPSSQYPPGPSLSEYAWAYFKEGFDFLRLARRLVKKYGDFVHVQIRLQHHFYVNQPDSIEKILQAGEKVRVSRPLPMRRTLGLGLITSEGDLHSMMRRFMQPYFQKQVVADKAKMISEQTQHLINKWQAGEVRDIFQDMTHLALKIIIQFVFGTAITDVDTIGKIEKAAGVVHHYSHQSLASYINMHVEELPFIGKFTPAAHARRFIEKITYGQIANRRAKQNFEGTDLLSVLLKLQQTPEGAKFLNDEQIRDELLTTFFAGHETTASALSWTFYLLSQHPEVERKFHEELDRVLNGRLPTNADLPNLPYTRMVLCESMRLYPPVWTMGRRPPKGQEFWIGGCLIPVKSMILISPYLIHHDERFYPDPERFDPERFTPEKENKRLLYTYFPFGGGNRRCIGESLAWLESILTLSIIASRWRLRLLPGHRVEMEPLISLKPKYGMRMIIESRTPQQAPVLSKDKFKKRDNVATCPFV